MRYFNWISIVVVGSIGMSGCASLRSFFATDYEVARKPIANPFTDYDPKYAKLDSVILRTKKGDRAVEIELPGKFGETTDLVVPMSPAFAERGRGIASVSGEEVEMDQTYKQKPPSFSDREIVSQLPKSSLDEKTRFEVEGGLGLTTSEDSTPDATNYSYLAAMDHIKALYKTGRYEAALLETDEMIRAYPTDSKLYSMRGTLFERLGKMDLAFRSWNQALRLDPQNLSLKRYVDRKQEKRSVASQ